MTDCYVVKIYQKKWNYIFQTGDVALRYRNITKQRFHADRRQKPFSALQTSITALRTRTRPSGKIPFSCKRRAATSITVRLAFSRNVLPPDVSSGRSLQRKAPGGSTDGTFISTHAVPSGQNKNQTGASDIRPHGNRFSLMPDGSSPSASSSHTRPRSSIRRLRRGPCLRRTRTAFRRPKAPSDA